MVLPADDARSQLARLLRAQQGSRAASPAAVQLGRATTRALIANPTLKDRIDAIASGEKQAPTSAWGTVLGNPLVKGALKGAEVLALPGRAVQSTIGEVVDALDNDPTTRGSIADWGQRMKDPTTGFGKSARINTGSKWLDRAIGFVGDVALDPITYATFGAGKFAGYSGRLNLAQKVLENTGDNALAAAVARQGRSALRGQPEVLERVGANKFGVYMFGKRLKVGANGQGIRVPLTGHIGEIGESTLAKIRLGITDTRLGKYAQKMTMPKDMLTARLNLARGIGGAEELGDTVRFLNSRPAQRAAEGAALQAFEQELMGLIKQEESLGDLNSYRKTLYKYIENPDSLVNATPSEQRAFQVWRDYYGTHKGRVEEGIRSVDPAATIKMRENYFPYVITDNGMAYVRSDTTHGPGLRRVFMNDPFAQPGAFTPRSLTEGSEYFGVILKKEDLNIDRLNQIARNAGFDGDFFETDIIEASKKYIRDAAKEMGIIERNRVLKDTGFFKQLDEARVQALEVDEDAIASARIKVEEVDNALKGADESYRSAITDLVDNIRIASKSVDSSIVDTQSGVSAVTRYLYDAREEMQRLELWVDSAKNKLISLFADPAEVPVSALSKEFPATLMPVLKSFDEISQEVSRYTALIDDAQARIAAGNIDVLSASTVADELESAAQSAMAAFRESQESVRSMMEMSNVIEATWNNITVGSSVTGKTSAHQMMRDISDVLGGKKKQTPRALRGKQMKAVGAEGSLKELIDGPDFKRVLDEIGGAQGFGAVNKTGVQKMNPENFMKSINTAFSDDAQISNLREAALYAIARDMQAHGAKSVDELPEMIRKVYDDLAARMKDAADYEVYRQTIAKGKKFEYEKLNPPIRKLQPLYDDAQFVRDTIEDYEVAIEFLDGFADDVLANERFSEDTIDGIQAAMRKQGINRSVKFMYDWLDEPIEGMNRWELSLNDVLAEMRNRASMLRSAFDNQKIDVPFDERWKNLQQFADGETVQMSHREVVEQYERLVGEQTRRTVIGKRIQARAFVESEVKRDLANSLIQYTAISDAVTKFTATSSILARHGRVPTEDMWRDILRTTYNTYGVPFQQRMSRINLMEDAMSDMYRAFIGEMQNAKRLAVESGEPVVASQIFAKVLQDTFDSENGDLIREAVGPSMSSLIDPYDLNVRRRELEAALRRSKDSPQARLAAQTSLDNFNKNYLIPWAKSFDPTIRSQPGPARDVLRSIVDPKAARSRKSFEVFGSPLSKDASEQNIVKWFDSFADKTQDLSTYSGTVGSATPPTISAGVVVFDGKFSRMRKQLWDTNRFFMNMRDGFLDPYKFFDDPMTSQFTPSGYGALISAESRRLGAASGVAAQRAEAQQALRGAEKQLATAESRAARAEQIASAFSDEAMTPQELKALGFTKEMLAARDETLRYRAFTETVNYAKAMQDKEMVDFLSSVAHVDFSKFSDGIVVGYNRRNVLESAIAGEVGSAQEKITRLYDQIDEIRSQQLASRKAVEDKFKAPDGSWQSRQAFRDSRREVRQWRSTTGAAFDERIQKLQEEINVTAAGVGLTPTSFEDVPIFATMPDGSKITFNATEWESLYTPQMAAGEVAALRREQRNLPKAVAAAREEIKRIRSSAGSYTKTKRLTELQDFINSAPARSREIDRLVTVASSEVRNSALEKLRVLMYGHPNQPRTLNTNDWLDVPTYIGGTRRVTTTRKVRDMLGRESVGYDAAGNSFDTIETSFNSNLQNATYRHYLTNPGFEVSDVSAAVDAGVRREGLESMWNKTSSYRILNQAQEIANSASLRTANSAETEARMLARAARVAAREAEGFRTELTDVQKRIRESVRNMRINEIRAAKAAGAEFDTMSRSYTLNGKTYEIPSFTEMVRNPERFAKRGEKMANLFFDLRKPGAVTTWSDMEAPQRATAAMWALHQTAKESKIAYNNFKLSIQDAGERISEIEGLMGAWSKDLGTLQSSLDSVRKALAVEQAAAMDEFKALNADALQARLDFWNLAEEVKAMYGDLADDPNLLTHLQTTLSLLNKRREMFKEILEKAPDARQTKSLTKVVRPDAKERLIGLHRTWLDRYEFELRELAKADLNNPGESRLFDSLMRASAAEARFIREQGNYKSAVAALDSATEGVYVDKVIKPFEEGYKKAAATYLKERNLVTAEDLNMPSYGINPDAKRILDNLARVNDGAIARDLGRMVGQYTSFFKAYATLSPGFHVRNSISNVAQMFAAGADVKNMRRGLQIYRQFGEHLRNGGTLESWMNTPAFKKLSSSEQTAARVAAEVNLALGGGNVHDAFREFMEMKRSVLTDNPMTRTSLKVGHRVEGSARFMLAFDSAIKGDDYLASFNRTKRFLFDYNDPSILDETVRNIIPFWTWMSRNLPLQIVNQWANPKPYVIYQRFANNFGIGQEEVVPQYMQEQGAFKVGEDTYVSPDLPWTKLQEQVAEFGQPRRLMSYLNPALRLPVELSGDVKFFNNQEFQGRYVPAGGKFTPFQPLLAALGQLQYDSQGNPVMSEKAQYAITSFLPMYGQAERLFPSTDAGDGAAWLRYAGVPVRKVNDEARERELMKRLRALQNMEEQRRRIEEAG